MIRTIPVQPHDESFLFSLFATTRQEEIAALAWDVAQLEAFLQMQFTAQHRSYAWQYPDADHQIIADGDRPIGRIVVDRGADAIMLVDIALLPEARGAGIGTALLKALQVQATAVGLPLRLSVFATNRARHLYERLGFTVMEHKDPYLAMQWLPASGGSA